MRNPFDHLAKSIGKEALDACGLTVVQREIIRGAQHADLLHEPDPARDTERARLGLLGRLAAVVCIIEVFAHAPDSAEIRACLSKHFAHWEERIRRARAQSKKRREEQSAPEPLREPSLWIVAAVVSAPILRKLAAEPAADFPTGVYRFGEDVLRAGIVVAGELPRDRSTLLVRLMAAGPLLAEAARELAALPDDAIERTVSEGILLHLQDVLGTKPSRTLDEEEFIVSMQGTWADARRLGRDEGRALGRTEEAARALFTVLRARGMVVSDAARERILAEKEPERLEAWLEKAAVAASIDEVLGDPS